MGLQEGGVYIKERKKNFLVEMRESELAVVKGSSTRVGRVPKAFWAGFWE